MPRIFGLDLSMRQMFYRLVESVFLSMLTFALLFYVPTVLPSQLSGFVVVTQSSLGRQLLSSLISPTAPTLGLFLVLVVFACALLRGSSVYGFLLVLNGLGFLVYIYSFFQGGTLAFEATGTAFGATDADLGLSLDVGAVMAAFMVPPTLTVVKGFMLALQSQKRRTMS